MRVSACVAVVILVCELAVAISGCGGGGGESFSSITVSPGEFTANPGDKIQFHAIGLIGSGSSGRDITGQVIWASSSTAAGTVDAAGKFTANNAGACSISATYSNLPPQSTPVTVEATPFQPTASWYPFGLGYQWTYTGTQVTPGASHPVQATTLTIRIDRQDARDGVVWWQHTIIGSNPADAPAYSYLRHTDQGLLQWRASGQPLPKLLQPLEQAHSWLDPDSSDHRFTIESVLDSVAVPAGTYDNCVRVREHEGRGDPPYDVLVWFAQGVGLVKEQTIINSEVVEEQQLTSVQFGAP